MNVHDNPTFIWARYYALKLGTIPILLHYVSRFESVWDPDQHGYKNVPVCSCAQGARCQNPGKHPIVGWKQKDISTPDKGLGVCADLLQQDPRYGLALRTGPESGIVVIDVDVRPDKRGDEALHLAIQKLGVDVSEMSTLQQITGSGGFHLVFRYPVNHRIPSVTNHPAFGPGVDIKGEGGIFNVAPSIHKNGNPYYWYRGTPEPDHILELPHPILTVIEKVSDLDPMRAYQNALLEAYTPTAEDLTDLALRLKAQRKSPKVRELGKTIEKAVAGEPMFPDGGAHDGYRDIAFSITREWPLLDTEVVLEILRPSLEARERLRPDASTDLNNLRDSFESAKKKMAEFRESWAAGLRRSENSELIMCTSNLVTICQNDPEIKDAISFDTRFKTLYLRKPIPQLLPPFPRTMTHEDETLLVAFMERKYGFTVPNKRDFIDTVTSAISSESAVDPLAEWMKSFEGTWDGVPRLETFMQRAAGTPDSMWVRRVFPLWMRGFVQRVLVPGSKNDLMLILEGVQGIRKSTFFKTLLPERRYFSDSLHKLSQDEGVLRALHSGPAIFEISELASFSKSTQAELKAFLSAEADQVRPLYKSTSYFAPRNFVIVGTTNDPQYLQDPTGARRFLPLEVPREIDLSLLHRERAQLYAEALDGLARGFPTHLSGEETAFFHAVTAARQEEDPWETAIENFLEQKTETTIEEVLTIAIDIELKQIARREQLRVTSVLRRLGWERVHTRRGNKWHAPSV